MAEQTKSDPTRDEKIAALPPLPERSRYVYNRTAEPWEAQFNGRVYTFEPHECKTLPAEIAEHFRAHSIIPGTLRRKLGSGGTLTAERAIALGPGWNITGSVKVDDEYVLQYAEAAPDADFFVESTTVPGGEIWDRSSIPNYVERPNVREGDQGKPTHAAILRV
jgi:hypothetical protein